MNQMGLKLHTSIDFMTNLSLLKKLGLWQLILFFVFYILNSILFFSFYMHMDININIKVSTIVQGVFGVIGGGIVTLILHELIHGLFFWLYSRKKVKFGFKNGVAYASCPGVLFTRRQFFIIVSSPFIVVTFILLLLQFSLIHPIVMLILVSWHVSACVGDFYMIKLILKAPSNILIEDTESGINLFIP